MVLPFDPRFFNDSRWPRLDLRLPGTLSSQGHEECLAHLSGYLRRGQRFVCVVDLSRVGLVPLEQRWRQVEWFEEHEALIRETTLGAAIIVTSPIVRLSVSAILYFKRLPLTLVFVSTLSEAEAWVAERLKEAGLAPPRP